MTHRVFVYGTLKRGYPNNPLLEGSEFLGEAVTVLTYNGLGALVRPRDDRCHVASVERRARLPTQAFIYVG